MTRLKLSDKEAISLGARMKAVRKALGYKKSADFQKALNFSATVYYQWELGRRKPDETALKKISTRCKINYEWLKTGAGSPFTGTKVKSKEKEAIISYELLTNKLAEKRKPIPSKLQKSIISYAEVEKAATSAQNIIYIHIKEELMAKILTELIQTFEDCNKLLDTKLLSKFASQIYADILSTEQDPKLQQHMIKPMAATYKRMIKNTK